MPFSRKKSCSACRSARARCNRATPSCHRCLRRNLQCDYHGCASEIRALYSQHSPANQVPASGPSENRQSIFSLGPIANLHGFDVLPTSSPAETALGYEQDHSHEWNLSDENATSALIGAQSLELLPHMASPPVMTLESNLPEQDINFPYVMIPALPELPLVDSNIWFSSNAVNSTAIARRSDSSKQALHPRYSDRACLATTVVLGQLSAYPKMMVNGSHLPPFIYPRCTLNEGVITECTENGKHHCLPEPLAICAGLVQMFYSRTAGNTGFVWKTIYAEQARLHREYEGYNSHELLDALQAITIYMLLQAYDSESINTNDAGSLVRTALDMAANIVNCYDWRSNISWNGMNRREWIVLESVRRTIALLYVIGLLLEGLMGAGERDICGARQSVPLPCTRELWEANSDGEWKRRYEQYLRMRKSDKSLTMADLIGLQTQSSNNTDSITEDPGVLSDLRRWCGDLDRLGMLIWTSVPFEKHRQRGT
ncbi:hypothetical protein F5884DRAFT_763206 [Xylogone sp. PMI_703]|nr:hypothetical protein F5884DRAFT_763206 [Xylogone sp. PMI_703]